MLGVYQHIPTLFDEEGLKNIKYKAGDTNKSVIMMWKASQKGWKPPSKVSEKRYNQLKNSSDSEEKGFVGHQYSFGGQYFKGYVPKYGKTNSYPRAVNKVVNISKKLCDVTFSSGSYTQYTNLKNYVIYCDPPYNNREQCYKNSFNSEKFYEWCRKMAKHNIVFISEYKAPKDFEEIFRKTTKVTGKSISEKYGKGKHTKRIEKLYLI